MAFVHCRKIVCFSFLIFFSVFIASCSVSESAKATASFGADADYFVGLQKLAEGKENEARTKFMNCAKKGSLYCAKKSAQILTTFGSVQQKNKACQDLIQKYQDSESLLIAVRFFYDSNEIHKVIALTENINSAEDDNALLWLRFNAMQKRGDSSFKDEVFKWFTLRPLSQQHANFYNEFSQAFLDDSDFRNLLIRFRIKVYERNYSSAISLAPFVLDCLESGVIPHLVQLASDIGKTYLYADSHFLENARNFENCAKIYQGTGLEFYFCFYAARFYEKAGSYKNAALYYKLAMDSSLEPEQKDNALWYLLENQLSISLKDAVLSLEAYAPLFYSPQYFDDFFDTLLSSLLHSPDRTLIYEAYSRIKGHATKETCAKYAYVYARLLQEGIVQAEQTAGFTNADRSILLQQLFEAALDSGSSLYYSLMAAYRLNYTDSKIQKLLYKSSIPHVQSDSDAENLLKGYAHFGFPEKIYSEWQKLPKDSISTDTAFMLSDFLFKCSVQNEDYKVQSMRIAARAAANPDRVLTFEEIKLIYPKNYSKYIDTFSQKYDITDSTVYALVRSESFFDSQVVSHAGAIGLSQLMPLTAQDVACKLKKSDYSLYNPEDNLEFGIYYLSELYRRCDNSMLLAFFSYNAGITRVRRWLSTSLAEFGRKGDLSGDLLLETLPYEETREYGRKLVSASAIYELLYSENSFDSCKRMIESLIY